MAEAMYGVDKDLIEKAKGYIPKDFIRILDDLDKFSNSSYEYCNTEEYVAIQAGIDECKNHDVFVFATAGNVSQNYDEKLSNDDYVIAYARGEYLLTREGEQIFKLPKIENTEEE